MAATLMQPPVHRPSMDHHSSSFDHSRSTSAPFASASFDRAPSPGMAGAPPRSRTNSSNSSSPIITPTGAAAAYPQYGNSNYPSYSSAPSRSGSGLPASSFYAPPFPTFPNGGPGAFQQGYHHQQPPPDFSAWAHVYQQMVAGGHMPPHGQGPVHPQQMQQQYQQQQYAQQHQQQQHFSQREEHDSLSDSSRRRTASGTSSNPATVSSQTPSPKVAQQPQPFHPYKRGPAQQRSMPRSASQPSSALNEMIKNSSSPRAVSSPSEDHRRTSSADSALRAGTPPDLAAPPRIRTGGERRGSGSSQTSSRSGGASRTGSPMNSDSGRLSSASGASKSAPLTSGVIAANASNAARPSPLSQPASNLPQPPAKKVPFKSRFKTSSAPDKDLPKKKDKKAQQAAPQPAPQPAAQPAPQPAPSRAVASSTSRSLPTANSSVPLAPPSAPFINTQAMGSDVSLAETERTAATGATGKSKRSMFRIRNKSADNISLASTVSTASAMLRKMGSLGKLARRNSLMGISKIFKDKPQDEDAPIPEKQGILSFKKKGGRKAELAPATVSPANAEPDRLSEDDDRVLTGLSPAAQLARQHTVRSRQEAAKRDAEAKRKAAGLAAPDELSGPTGEPTWDNNTTNRNQAQSAGDRTSIEGANIVRINPRSPEIVRHAFAVNQPDYDSEDSSDGDTIDDMTASMTRTHISDAADAEFQAMWGKADIDRNARPKKGILKQCVSSEDMEMLAHQQRSTPSSRERTPVSGGHLSTDLPGALGDIDGVPHAAHFESPIDTHYDPLSPDFSPFDSKPFELSLEPATYQAPVRNTSAPALPKLAHPQTARSMTAPAARRRLIWAPECAVYSTYDAVTYDRRSEPATCNRLTPELAMAIKQELNAFKLEMPVHPSSRPYTHYFA